MIEQYINFIVKEIIKDGARLDFDYGGNYFIIPYAYWLVLFFLKYIILTIPIWVPFNLIVSQFKLFVVNINKFLRK